jgi:hypothetical protein
MTSGIFISYRRSDSKSEARSICQRLERTFGKGMVFIDVDSIRPGEDFQSVLEEDLAKCNVMLVVIGPRWLELLRSGPAGCEIINDYVRLEIASALERKLPIFPVLVDGAPMPDAKNMPDDLKSLALRQAFSVRHDSFPRDMSGLEQELRRFVPARAIWKVAVMPDCSRYRWARFPTLSGGPCFRRQNRTRDSEISRALLKHSIPRVGARTHPFVRRTDAVSESCPGTRASRSEPGRDRKP